MCTVILCFVILVLFITNNSVVINGAACGLMLWYNNVIPVLLPFMLLSNIMVSRIGRYTNKTSYAIITTLFLGIFCGYPLGAKTSSDFVKKGSIPKTTGNILIPLCNNSSPMFIAGYIVHTLLNDQITFPRAMLAIYIPYIIFIIVALLICKTVWDGSTEYHNNTADKSPRHTEHHDNNTSDKSHTHTEYHDNNTSDKSSIHSGYHNNISNKSSIHSEYHNHTADKSYSHSKYHDNDNKSDKYTKHQDDDTSDKSRKYTKHSSENISSTNEPDIIMDSVTQITYVGIYIMICSIIIEFIKYIPGLPLNKLALLSGITEITNGTHIVSTCNAFSGQIKTALVMAFTSFGGISAILQTKKVISHSGLSIISYIIIKTICAVGTFYMTLLLI